jgi:REP element-mobilizing transposase RayT
LNHGNNRARVFHKEDDFAAFADLLVEAKLRHPMRILADCVMPNHFHLALSPLGDGELGRGMHWLLTAHVRRYPCRGVIPTSLASWLLTPEKRKHHEAKAQSDAQRRSGL